MSNKDEVSSRAAAFLAQHGEKLKLNQYWYSIPTIETLVEEIEERATKVAFLSTPSLFFSLKNQELANNSILFDYDEMWASHPCFVKYDYKHVEHIPKEYHGVFDYVVIDPPFVTDVVWELYAKAAKLLLCEGSHEIIVPSSTLMNDCDVVEASFLDKAESRISRTSINFEQIGDINCDGKVSVKVPKGKVLLTTIPEHVQFLHQLLGASIRRFRPSIPNLIYQYSLYTNYPSAILNKLNPEIDPHTYKPPPRLSAAAKGILDAGVPTSASAPIPSISAFAYADGERPIQSSRYGGFSSQELDKALESQDTYVPSGKPKVLHSSKKKAAAVIIDSIENAQPVQPIPG